MLPINLSDSTLDEAKIKFEGPSIKEFILKAFFQKICDWLDTIRLTSFFSSNIKEIIHLNLDLLSIMFSLKNRLSSNYTNQLFCVVPNSNYIFV